LTAILRYRKKEYEVNAGITIRAALIELEIPPNTVFPTRDGKLIPTDEILKEGDTIRIFTVISGGSSRILSLKR
jgi:sulfur carrier protein ThiS